MSVIEGMLFGAAVQKIDPADYGVDLFALFTQGGGTVNLQDAEALWDMVLPHDGIVMMTVRNAEAGIAVDIPAAKQTQGTMGALTGQAMMIFGDRVYNCKILIGSAAATIAVEDMGPW